MKYQRSLLQRTCCLFYQDLVLFIREFCCCPKSKQPFGIAISFVSTHPGNKKFVKLCCPKIINFYAI